MLSSKQCLVAFLIVATPVSGNQEFTDDPCTGHLFTGKKLWLLPLDNYDALCAGTDKASLKKQKFLWRNVTQQYEI